MELTWFLSGMYVNFCLLMAMVLYKHRDILKAKGIFVVVAFIIMMVISPFIIIKILANNADQQHKAMKELKENEWNGQ